MNVPTLQANVVEWIRRNGQRSTLRRITQGEYIPATGLVDQVVQDVEVYCVFYTRRVNSIAVPMNTIPNTFVMKAMIDISEIEGHVTTADRIIANSGEWSILKIEEVLAPDGSIMTVQCEVSRL